MPLKPLSSLTPVEIKERQSSIAFAILLRKQLAKPEAATVDTDKFKR
jgi:hypothetical protein